MILLYIRCSLKKKLDKVTGWRTRINSLDRTGRVIRGAATNRTEFQSWSNVQSSYKTLRSIILPVKEDGDRDESTAAWNMLQSTFQIQHDSVTDGWVSFKDGEKNLRQIEGIQVEIAKLGEKPWNMKTAAEKAGRRRRLATMERLLQEIE